MGFAAGRTGNLAGQAVVADRQHCEAGKLSLDLGLVVVVEAEGEGTAAGVLECGGSEELVT